MSEIHVAVSYFNLLSWGVFLTPKSKIHLIVVVIYTAQSWRSLLLGITPTTMTSVYGRFTVLLHRKPMRTS